MKTKNEGSWQEYWKSYWKTVVKCIARLDGITEIHYENGFVEYLNINGRRISISKKNEIKT